jgi:hypothetical protein
MGDLYRSGEEKSNEGLVDQHHRVEKMKERIGSRRERVNFSGSSMTGKKREREKAVVRLDELTGRSGYIGSLLLSAAPARYPGH